MIYGDPNFTADATEQYSTASGGTDPPTRRRNLPPPRFPSRSRRESPGNDPDFQFLRRETRDRSRGMRRVFGGIEDEDAVRLLPNCKHAFHVTCIDQWFAAHASCPLCRSPIVLDQIANVVPLIDAHNRIGDSNRRISSEPSTINGGGRESSSSSSPPRAQSFGLLRHCASLVLPPPEDRTPPPRRLKRSLSMDQSIAVIDLERINCSSASSLSHFDWVSSNWFRSFSRLRAGKGNNINATILPY
ncbi:hypothetical protein DH2020_026203 [Rehmannia glutinosa]|uniref:RING-type E3 ubiquitin transferase n=1 Tax=Rehmannia glutinosa TaxID=99300 RepID=A0ABR0VXR0_REHGL